LAKKIIKPRREFTRQELFRWEKEKRRQHIIFAVGLFLVVGVLLMLGGAWLIVEYKPLHETAIRVNDTKFNMQYLINMLKLYGQGRSGASLYSQIDSVVQMVERNEILRQGAEKLGFTASSKEISEKLKSQNPPLSKDYRDIARAEVLSEKLRHEYFNQQIPSVAPQVHLRAMLLESESQAAEARGRIVSGGESFADVASNLSVDLYSQLKAGDLGWQSQEALAIRLGTPVPGDYAFKTEPGGVSEPLPDDEVIKRLGYWLIKLNERRENPARARINVMLLSSEEKALEVRERLEAGEDFAALAKEFSVAVGAQEDGGDVGWVSPGTITPAFDDFVFGSETEPGTLSEVIKDEDAVTKGGFWLVEVLDRDESRQLEDGDRNLLEAKLLDDWVTSLLDDPSNEIDHSYLTDEKKLWLMKKVSEGSSNS